MNTCFWDSGLQFSCKRCSRCCRHEPGVVYLSSTDILNIADTLALSVRDVLDQYCRPIFNDAGYRISLKEKPNLDCIFWDHEKGCSIYTVRPLQCSTFPFWESILADKSIWDEQARYCPGINNGTVQSREVISGKLNARRTQPLLLVASEIPWDTIHENTILGHARLNTDALNKC